MHHLMSETRNVILLEQRTGTEVYEDDGSPDGGRWLLTAESEELADAICTKMNWTVTHRG